MSRRILIVVNPFSGKKKASQICTQLVEQLNTRDLDHAVYETEFSNNTAAIKAELEQGYTDMIVLGGDGTLNHAANALGKHDVTISTIPCGTGNDFAKNISLGETIEDQINTAIDGRVVAIDAGLCNDQVFLNGVGMGFDGQIVYNMLNKKSLLKGHAKYYAEVLGILATYKPQELSYNFDNQDFKERLILLVIGNGTTFGGGFKLTPSANVMDGYLDVCTIGQVSAIRRFLNIHKLSSGTHDQLNEIQMDQTKRITIESNPLVKAHIDGEYLGTPPFDIRVLPAHFNFRVKS